MALTSSYDCNYLIYSYLNDPTRWILREVSKGIKNEVEPFLHCRYQWIGEWIKNKNFTWQISRKSKIKGTIPYRLHTAGKKLQVLDDRHQLWTIDPHDSLNSQLITLEKINRWNEVFWNNRKIALVSHFSNQNFEKKKYSTHIFNAENGNPLADLSNTSFYPIDWFDQQLLMKEEKGKDLWAWRPCEHESPPLQRIFSFDTPVPEIRTCQNEYIYYLNTGTRTPFSRIDLPSQSIVHLDKGMAPYESNSIRNFGVTDVGNIFFSLGYQFNLLDGASSRLRAEIKLPIFPHNIIFQFPLMACYKETQLIVYDIKKSDKPLYNHNFLNKKEIFKHYTSLSNYVTHFPFLPGPYSDCVIRSMVFHQSSLFIAKGDNSIEHLDLSASCSKMTTVFNKLCGDLRKLKEFIKYV